MIKFESQYDETSRKITVEVQSDSTLSEVVSAFEDFLKATGYVFTERLEFIEDEEHSNE